ncbi:MAG: hypothetical protein H7Z40_00245 [Phycisphaerae bacterium]|nr:hypothetical protein [Gemmatimonadaceae bacterium]
MTATLRVSGGATVYRLYDVGYTIALDRAATLLGDRGHGRVLPRRDEARAIEIRNPPLFAELGFREMLVNGETYTASLSAHLFDFGVCSLHLQITAPENLTWPEFSAFGVGVAATQVSQAQLDNELHVLLNKIGPAIERPAVAPLTEDFVVYRIDGLESPGDNRTVSEQITNEALAPLLFGDQRPLASTTLRELMPHRFSYYDDDLTVLTWENALVVEPRQNDLDVEFVLEFANAQLLELRLYDLQLGAELPALYDRVDSLRARRPLRLSRGFREVLAGLQTQVADVTETVERVENALKVTNDVYLARIYAAALELFREQAWRNGIERKLTILRETYAMLNGEALAARAELLELSIVVLIVAELSLSVMKFF